MKKKLLFTVILSIAMSGYSQKRADFTKEQTNKSVTVTLQKPVTGGEVYQIPVIPNSSLPGTAKDELIAGGTIYDVQSNSLLANRFWLYDDGTAGAVWTMGLDNNISMPNRGTGYNYYDGMNWGTIPTERIETGYRCGWPSYAAFGENGEIVVSHIADGSFPDGGLIMNIRPQKGTGEWIQSYIPGPEAMGGTAITWPRMTTSGENHEIIHIIVPAADAYANQDVPLFYIKSDDGGETWTDWTILEQINSDYYSGFHADDYVWAESRGSTIAFTVSSPWHDWIVMKSTDNGDTWQKIIIWEHPYPMWDWDNTITTDTIWAPDYSADIAIGSDGMVHAVCGLTRVAHTEPGTSFTVWPFTDGIVYWNETMPPFTAENQHRALAYENLVEDETLIGYVVDTGTQLLPDFVTYPELGICTMPSIMVGSDDNTVYIAWSALAPGYDNGQTNFRHIFRRYSSNNGVAGSWSSIFDIDTEITHWLHECIYPVLAGDINYTSEGKEFHLIYFTDGFPGLYFLNNPTQNDPDDYTIYHYSEVIPGTGIEKNTEFFDVAQNVPNPANRTTVIKVKVSESSKLSLEVVNILGQQITFIDKGEVNRGMYDFKIDVSSFKSGIYFYIVKAGNSSVIKRMIVE